jgi:hypothetical protein
MHYSDGAAATGAVPCSTNDDACGLQTYCIGCAACLVLQMSLCEVHILMQHCIVASACSAQHGLDTWFVLCIHTHLSLQREIALTGCTPGKPGGSC